MTFTAIAPADIGRRTAVIEGLANLSAFLQTHPLPLAPAWSADPFRVYVYGGTDEEQRAEVDRIAGILGTEPGWMSGSRTHYTAVRHFGGGVTYRVLAVDSRYKVTATAESEAAA